MRLFDALVLLMPERIRKDVLYVSLRRPLQVWKRRLYALEKCVKSLERDYQRNFMRIVKSRKGFMNTKC